MRISLKWLKDYIDLTLPVAELAGKLTMSGNEVGSIEKIGGDWDNVLIGRVTALEKHPNADRLLLATVDLGAESLTVVTGAPNLREGQKVPFAKVGAELIDGYTGKRSRLKPVKIRGVSSAGMVCSEKELGLSDQHEGIMVLPEDAPVGRPLSEYLGDSVLDIKTTPNRSDCLSVIGISREVAALTGRTPRAPEISYREGDEPAGKHISVEIHDPAFCSRYCASLVTGVKIGPSPYWMQERLLASGMRPISNIVDITNYVMLEYGQPLHAFDYKEIKGKKIVVRLAREGESLYTLDGVKRDLEPDMLVIADEKDPVALAGVMGGAETEVIDTTMSILLESANFNGASIRRTSTRLNLRSEASSRFEKGLSPELAPIALRRATQLLVELSGGQAARGIVDVYPGRKETGPLLLPGERVSRILGLDLSADQVQHVFSSLGFESRRAGDNDLLVTVPYWRTDIRIADDLVEEIARIRGYDEIPTTMLRGAVPERVSWPMLDLKGRVRDLMAASGLYEIITYSLVSKAVLEKVSRHDASMRVANPMSQEQEYLRTSLRPGLLGTLASNQRHDSTSLRFFELGRIYVPRDRDLPDEREMLAAVLAGPRHSQSSWVSASENMDFFDAKGVLETIFDRLRIRAAFEPGEDSILLPGRTAAISAGGDNIGVIGELHPKTAALFDISVQPVILFELDMQRLLPLTGQTAKYQPVPRFPAISRDLALVVDAGVAAGKVQEAIATFPLVSEVRLFDIYSGDQVPAGKKSLAFSIRYQSLERTLTDAEVDNTQKRIVERARSEFSATLRG
ncbi:MAG: phenylalanine--tRNA ligase subunit beta [Dehalococcoidia bacterium]|nr:phenylalanine--tRNA ligase subunit beta [Dehalococcoidia bacterium]